MPETQPREVFDILLESLKIQAEKYKVIVSQDALTHDQRKDFDSEIKQMYELLSNMTNSSTVYTLSEIQQLKIQYELKIQELQNTLDNIDVTTVKGDVGEQGIQGEKGLQGLQGIQGEKGEKGDTGLQGIQGEKGDAGLQGIQGIQGEKGEKGEKGETGLQGLQGIQGEKGQKGDTGLQGEKGLDGAMTFSDLTLEQKLSLKGEKGDTGLQGEKGDKGDKGDIGSQGIPGLKGDTGLQGIKGDKGDKGDAGIQGSSLTYNDLTPEQKQELANLVPVLNSGGASSNKIILKNFSSSFAYLHIKTSFLLEDSFTFRFNFCQTDLIYGAVDCIKIYRSKSTTLKQNLAFGSEILLVPYYAADGSFCFCFKVPDLFPLLEFIFDSDLDYEINKSPLPDSAFGVFDYYSYISEKGL